MYWKASKPFMKFERSWSTNSPQKHKKRCIYSRISKPNVAIRLFVYGLWSKVASHIFKTLKEIYLNSNILRHLKMYEIQIWVSISKVTWEHSMLIYLCNVCGWFSLHQGWIVSTETIYGAFITSHCCSAHYNCRDTDIIAQFQVHSSCTMPQHVITYYQCMTIMSKQGKKKTLNFECHIFKA